MKRIIDTYAFPFLLVLASFVMARSAFVVGFESQR